MLNDDKCDVFKLKLAVGSYISTGLHAEILISLLKRRGESQNITGTFA